MNTEECALAVVAQAWGVAQGHDPNKTLEGGGG